MSENLERHLAGLETELSFAEFQENDEKASEISKEISSTKKRIAQAAKAAEKAVADTGETPEDGPAPSETPTGDTGETPEDGELACPDCDRTFKNAGGLASHQTAKHGDE